MSWQTWSFAFTGHCFSIFCHSNRCWELCDDPCDGGNATLAANIIAITTVGSFFTTAMGIYFLRSLGVM
ncbi:putative AEC family malate permease [Yersinia pekkanenii]|uniref:AEC family malate permease n=1 Tax=Yersinia pekkanenii TaxID=1288385 RepID=A0A0T9NF37_9GAMM|nr:putative AEC family malate permease [Yersinia pekkanenii]CRY64030.1 putative AEC family malate permease [Yersinia pekkanenii]